MSRTLIIDDSQTTLTILAALLREAGHVVETRDEALGASPVIARFKPDCILVDVDMPALNGDSLVKLLKSQPVSKGVIFLLCSAKAENELAILTQECGAHGYVQKSADPDDFLMRLMHTMASMSRRHR